MPYKTHPFKKLRRYIQEKLNSQKKSYSRVSPQMTSFLRNRGSEIVTMTTL